MEYSVEDLKQIAGCDIKQSNTPNLNCPETVTSPLETLNNKISVNTDRNLEGLADRLNSLLGNEFGSTVKVERL